MNKKLSVYCFICAQVSNHSFEHMDSVDLFMQGVRAALADTELIAAVERGALQLREEGYTVIPNVLSRELCDRYHGEFWQMIQEASLGRLWRPHSAADLAGFVAGGNWPMNTHGILLDGHFSHFPFMHDIRRNPRVQLPYALIYGDGRNLTSSMDRANYQTPPEWKSRVLLKNATDPVDMGHVDEAKWLHIDQTPDKQGTHCIQGYVTLEDADQDGDASLEMVPRTHLFHENLHSLTGDPNIPKKGDWYKFPADVKEKIQRETGLLRGFTSVKARKGDLVLWDSRLWHQGGRIRAHKDAPRLIPRPRFVVYTCFQPNLIPGAVSLPPNELVKRVKMVTEHRAASHWPLANNVFGKPWDHGNPQGYFDFSPFLVPGESLDVLSKHTYGLAYDARIDLLDGQVREPLLDFAPASGVNKHHPPAPPPVKKQRAPIKKQRAPKRPTEGTDKRPMKRARKDVIVID